MAQGPRKFGAFASSAKVVLFPVILCVVCTLSGCSSDVSGIGENKGDIAENTKRIQDVEKELNNKIEELDRKLMRHQQRVDQALPADLRLRLLNLTNRTNFLHAWYEEQHQGSPEAWLLKNFDKVTDSLNETINPWLKTGYSAFVLGGVLIVLAYLCLLSRCFPCKCAQKLGSCLDSKCLGERIFEIMRKLGLDVVILGIYTAGWENCFALSLGFILAEGLIWGVVKPATKSQSCRQTTSEHGPESEELIPTETQATDLAREEATNVYQQLHKPFLEVCVLFLTQTGIMMYLVDSFIIDSGMHELQGHMNMARWFLAVLFQLTCSAHHAGENNWGVWRRSILSSNFDCTHLNCLEKWVLLRLRCSFDFFINVACRKLILYTFPVMLSTCEPIEFVMNCTAIFFILTLDDRPSLSLKVVEHKLEERKACKMKDVETTWGEREACKEMDASKVSREQTLEEGGECVE